MGGPGAVAAAGSRQSNAAAPEAVPLPRERRGGHARRPLSRHHPRAAERADAHAAAAARARPPTGQRRGVGGDPVVPGERRGHRRPAAQPGRSRAGVARRAGGRLRRSRQRRRQLVVGNAYRQGTLRRPLRRRDSEPRLREAVRRVARLGREHRARAGHRRQQRAAVRRRHARRPLLPDHDRGDEGGAGEAAAALPPAERKRRPAAAGRTGQAGVHRKGDPADRSPLRQRLPRLRRPALPSPALHARRSDDVRRLRLHGSARPPPPQRRRLAQPARSRSTATAPAATTSRTRQP